MLEEGNGMSLARKMKRQNIVNRAELDDAYKRGVNRGVQRMVENTEKAISEAYDRGFNDASMKAHVYMAIMAVAVLHDKFGFGKERARRFSDALGELTDSVNQGFVSTRDVMQMLVDDGLDFCSKVSVDDGKGNSYYASLEEMEGQE